MKARIRRKSLLLALGFLLTSICCFAQNEEYELHLPDNQPQKGVLILFPGFGETPEDVEENFKILEPATKAGFAVVFMKLNQQLWLEDSEKDHQATLITQLFQRHNLDRKNVTIGGFSSGGNMAILISSYLVQTGSDIQPQGAFIIDSPIDLLASYEMSSRKIKRISSPTLTRELRWNIDQMEAAFGKPEINLGAYEAHSVYTDKTKHIDNLLALADVKLRFYTEPDTLWWKQNRMIDYEDMNAYSIKQLSNELTHKFGNSVEYIATENRGIEPTANATLIPGLSWTLITSSGGWENNLSTDG